MIFLVQKAKDAGLAIERQIFFSLFFAFVCICVHLCVWESVGEYERKREGECVFVGVNVSECTLASWRESDQLIYALCFMRCGARWHAGIFYFRVLAFEFSDFKNWVLLNLKLRFANIKCQFNHKIFVDSCKIFQIFQQIFKPSKFLFETKIFVLK